MNLNGTTFLPFLSDGEPISELTPQLCYQNWGHATGSSGNYVYYTPSLWMPTGGGNLSILVDQDFDYNITTTYFKIYEDTPAGSSHLYNFIKDRIINQNTYPTKVFNYFYTDDDEPANVSCQNEQIMILVTQADGNLNIEGKLKSSDNQTGAGFPFMRAETAMTFWLGFLGGGSPYYSAGEPATQTFYNSRSFGDKRFNNNIGSNSTYSVPFIPNITILLGATNQSSSNYAVNKVTTTISCSDMVEAIQAWVNGNILGITSSGNTRIKNLNFSGGIPRGQSPLQPNGYNAYLADTNAQQLGPVVMENVNILNNWLGQTDGPDIISENTLIENCLIQSADDTLKIESASGGEYFYNTMISGNAGSPIAIGGYGNSGSVDGATVQENSIIRLCQTADTNQVNRGIFNLLNNTKNISKYGETTAISILNTYLPTSNNLINRPNRILNLGYDNDFSPGTAQDSVDSYYKININNTYCYPQPYLSDRINSKNIGLTADNVPPTIQFSNLELNYTENFIIDNNNNQWYMPYPGLFSTIYTPGDQPSITAGPLAGEPNGWDGNLIPGQNPNNYLQTETFDNPFSNIDSDYGPILTSTNLSYTKRSALP
jgi:hypothetical protein